jgi:beta-glucosidase
MKEVGVKAYGIPFPEYHVMCMPVKTEISPVSEQYQHYKEDIALLARLWFQSYRFSIAWLRILPEGAGKINPEGGAYYRVIFQELHNYGIKACATIYHWDLPQVLQNRGGWTDRSIVDTFEEFARVCFRDLGDLVDQWITTNEQFCITYLEHLYGEHALWIQDMRLTTQAIHPCQPGRTVSTYRQTGLKAPPIGITMNLSAPRPVPTGKETKK